MLQGVSIAAIAKACAAVAVTAGAGVATYEVAIADEPPAVEESILAEGSASAVAQQEGPEALAFGDKSEELNAEVAEAEQREKELEEQRRKEAEEAEQREKELEEQRRKEAEEREAEEKRKEEEEKAKEEDVDTTPPELVILSPENDSHHDDEKIVFEGETEPGALVKAGRYEADVDAEGHWRIELILSPGANRAVIHAYDAAGNVSEAAVTVHLEVPEEEPKEPKPEPPANVEFSANQKWGTCDDVVPYDKFWGTATPDTVVHIVSEFGSAEVEVDEWGHWEKKVYFPEAPRGEWFLVVVEAVNGRAEFEFLAVELPEEEPEEPTE